MAIAGTDPCSIGEGMYRWTKRSILNRQKILGKNTDRTLEEINYINNKRPWIKMASSVKVTAEGQTKLSKNGLSGFSGRSLAKNFVLFGGTSVGTNNSRAGIGNGFYGAYGIGGTDFGYKPMPAITNLRVRTKGKLGNLKEAQLTIKAYNRQQYSIIEMLYLRLGYTILVEFGHNYYISKSGNVRTVGGTIVDNYWFEDNNFEIDSSELTYYNNLVEKINIDSINDKLEGKAKEAADKINQQVEENLKAVQNSIIASRIQYQGHYDGIVGKVTNFDYSIDKEGIYNINLTIISYGDLFDSMYINTKKVFPNDGEIGDSLATTFIGKAVSFFSNLFGGEEEPDPPEIPDLEKKFLKNAKDVTDINGILYMFYDALYNSSRGNSYDSRSNLGDPWKYYTGNINGSIPKAAGKTKADIFDIKVKGSDDDTLGFGYTDDKYISLGYYLEIINKFTLGYVVEDPARCGISSVKDKENSPVYIDNREDRFFCNTHAYQISADPTICLVKNIGAPAPVITGSEYKTYKKRKLGYLVGDIMNIYLQMNFLAELCYNAAKDKEGKITVKQHIEDILVKVNESLGGINKLSLKIDEDTNIGFIIDEAPFAGRKKIQNLVNGGINETDNVELVVYGFKPEDNQGSIVKDFGIKTKIPKELQTIITIGAQDSGYTPGFDATAFANWNKGLEDVIMPSLVVAAHNQETAQDAKKELTNNQNSLGTLANKLYKNDEKVKVKYIEQTKNTLNKYLTSEQALLAVINRDKGEGSSPGVGIIPISLDLTLDGLSGVKVFQTYTISSKFLPSQYNEALDFILKGYTHEINDKQWITKFESFSIPTDSGEPTKTLVEMSASKLAELITEAESEKNDAEFEAQTTLYESRKKVQSGAGLGALSASGGATSFFPASLNGAAVQAAPRNAAADGIGMPEIDLFWQKTPAKWFPYDKAWIQANGEKFSYNSAPQTLRSVGRGVKKAHGGFDVAVPGSLTAQIIAPIGGKVTIASNPGGFGPRYPQIKATWEGKSITVMIGHVSSIAPGIESGTIVKAGDFIATQGNEGASTGPHLHMDVRYTENGKTYMIDPNAWLDSLPIPNNAYIYGT